MTSASALLSDILNEHPRIRRIADRLLSNTPLAMRFGRAFWDWYAFFEESEQWSVSQLEAYQIDRVRTLLGELSRTSTFYEERFAGLDLQALGTMDQFRAQVPVLSRQQFRKNYAKIRSSSDRRQRLTKSQTSGTTGMALQFYHPLQDEAREWAAICHQWKRVGYVPGKSKRAEFRGLTTRGRLVDFYPHIRMIRCSILNLKTDHLRRYAGEIRRHEIDFYHGYPSALYLLAKEICNSGIDFPQPRALLLASEMVYDWQLDQIQAAFPDSKLFAHYGCAERTVLAGWCEYQREYHVLPQYSLVEVDEETTEIIGTNLYNAVNGFVRYCITDTALWVERQACPDCGRPYVPRLAVGGRSEDYLYSPRNGWIPPAIATYPLKGLHQIEEMQLLQKEEDALVVFYAERASVDTSVLANELERVQVGMHRLLGEEVEITFEKVDGFSRDSSGKFKWIISDLDAVTETRD